MKLIPRDLTSQRGAVLPMVLLILLFLMLLGSMAMNTSSIEIRLAASERNYQQAVYAAEAGVAHMRAILENVLNECNQGNFEIDWKFAFNPLVVCPPLAGQRPVKIVNAELGLYTYNVILEATDDDQQILVRSIATNQGGGRAEVEMLLEAKESANQGTPPPNQFGGGVDKNFVGRDRYEVDLSVSVDGSGNNSEASEVFLGN